jgi:hypothetical protein
LPLIMGGNNIESILFIRTVADLWDPVSLPRGQKGRFITPFQGAELMVLSMGDGILTHLP